MALKHYAATTATSGGTSITVNGDTYHAITLATVASGYELAVCSTRINGGANGGEVYIEVVKNSSTVGTVVYSVAANDVIYIDAKEFYEAGESIRIYSLVEGICVELFADYSAVA